MIRDSAAWIATPEQLGRIRALRYTLPGIDPTQWSTVAQLGWLGLRTPEADGGVGMGVSEFCALAEMLGAGLLPESMLHVVAITPLLPDTPRRAVIEGNSIVLPAVQEKLGDPLAQGDGVKRFIPYAAA